MSWNLIQSIQSKTDLRLILPFGLHLQVGDIVSVQRDGNFVLEGRSKSLLEMAPGTTRSGKPVDLMTQSGEGTEFTFRAAGTASSLFPELPHANAGFDVSFSHANGWLLAVTGRTLTTLDELNQFRERILRTYRNGVWRPDWALVTSVATISRMTLIASTSANTQLALSLGANVSANAALSAKLTSDVAIVATNREVTHSIVNEPAPAFCSGLRVQERWFRSPDIGSLETRAETARAASEASDNAFWQVAEPA